MNTALRTWWLAIVTVGTSACGPPRPPQDVAPRTEVPFADNWGSGPGCTPRGEVLTLSGTIAVRPFGKGSDGALLVTSAGEWILSYRAEGALLDLRGARVVARGRACDKQGASLGGAHLDLESVTRSGS
jgi:hypothetical protein